MTDKLDSAMIRELSGDELLMVAGGLEMERDAVRYNAPKPPPKKITTVEKCYVCDIDGKNCVPVPCPPAKPAK